MTTAVEWEEDQMPHSAAKIKLQLFPLDKRIRKGLKTDGHNPYLELILRPRKKVSSLIKHLCSKWGSSSVATGKLLLFPFNILVDNLSSSDSWTSSDVGISAGDVHEAIGFPDIFRLRYGWVSSHLNNSGSSLSFGCTEPIHFGNIDGPRILTEGKKKVLKPYDMNEVTNMVLSSQSQQSVSAEPQLSVHKQAEMKNEDLKSSKTSNIVNKTADEENSSAEQLKYELGYNPNHVVHTLCEHASIKRVRDSNDEIADVYMDDVLNAAAEATEENKDFSQVLFYHLTKTVQLQKLQARLVSQTTAVVPDHWMPSFTK